MVALSPFGAVCRRAEEGADDEMVTSRAGVGQGRAVLPPFSYRSYIHAGVLPL